MIAKRAEDSSAPIISYPISLEPCKELVVGTSVEFLQLDNHTCPDIQLAGLIFLVSASTNVDTTALELCTELLLRKIGIQTQPPEVGAHIQISSDFLLLHGSYTPHIDQYWLQPWLVYDILFSNIDRDIGLNAR